MQEILELSQLQDKLKKLDDKEILADVRSQKSYQKSHIPGAINLPLSQDNFLELTKNLDKSKTYIIHCNKGGSARRWSKKLAENGFDVIFSKPGFGTWTEAGLGAETSS